MEYDMYSKLDTEFSEAKLNAVMCGFSVADRVST